MNDIPEDNALMYYLMRNESLRHLEIKLSENSKITQEFLKHALGILIQSNMDLEHKLSMAILKIEELERKGDVIKKSAEYFAQKTLSTICTLRPSHPSATSDV